MKKTTLVTLFSLLVFPGAGHLILKRYLLATGFIVSSLYILFGFVQTVHDKMQSVADKVVKGEIPLEIVAINEAVLDQEIFSDPSLSFSGYFLLIIWLIAAFDAYRIAKNEEKEKTLPTNG